jgi:GNAT superfamily N-acetyltransferase
MAVRSVYPVLREVPCFQVVYETDERLPDGEDLIYRRADKADLAVIIENYDRESPENLKKLQEDGKIISAFQKSDGAFVGFIGRHPEGSMGLLLIFPEYRRHGFAYHLEGRLINEILDEGRLPYAHIVEDNDKSLALQKKLGFSIADEKITWQKIG